MAANAANIITQSKQELGLKCTRITSGYREKSWQSRWNRRAQNLANWNAYHSRQDWSHKLPWQTQQTIAEFGISIEQSVGTLERGLTDTPNWLTVDPIGIGDPLIDPEIIAALLKYYLDRLWIPGDAPETSYNFANLLGDGIKRALLESVLTSKVTAMLSTKYQYRLVESKPIKGKLGHRESLSAHDFAPLGRQKIERDPIQDFRLNISLVPWEDYFPDSSLQNKFTIHEVTMLISDLSAIPDFDPKAIAAVRGNAGATYSDMYKRVTQDTVFIAHDPDEVRVQECWGDLIDPDTGEVLATNSFWTVCNGHLLRPPTPNPFWHGKRPFVSAALLRNPNSTVHKALADDAVNTWQFLNELVSLMFDGALASVWGKGQMRSDYVENVDDFNEGIPQAATFLLRPNTPEGYKAWEALEGGSLPDYAMKIFELAMRQFQTAMATNDLKLGQQPPQEATATCVPMWTEALTRTGWKSSEELQIGEEMLGVNPRTSQLEWTRLEGLNFYESAPTVLYYNSEWKTVCTPNHRWAWRRYDTHKARFADGALTVSAIAEMPECSSIWTTAMSPAPDGQGLGYVTISEFLNRADLVQTVLKMTQVERQAFIVGCLAGEGFTRPSHGSGRPVVIFTQNEGPVLDAFRLACFLEGIRTSCTKGKPVQTKSGEWKDSARHSQLFYHSPVWKMNLRSEDAGEQPVWCPTTTLGTWVMRQGDIITITGNSVVEAMQAAGSLFESIAARTEDTWVEPNMELAWMTILQYEFDHKLVDPALVQILGPERVLQLTQMSNEERFVLLSQSAKFKCRGLRGVTARSRILTKLANMIQLFMNDPTGQLMQSFLKNRSMDRLVDQLVLNSGIDPTTLEKTSQEKAADEAQQQVDAVMSQLPKPPGTPGGGPPPNPPGAPPGTVPPANGGSPPAPINASQDQTPSGGAALAPKTPSGQVPGAPQPGMG